MKPHTPVATLVLAVFAAACGGGPPKPSPSPTDKNVGEALADTTWDTQVLGDASRAANEVVRNAGDCEAVLPILAEAKAKLDQAQGRLRTVSGHATLDALRRQVARVQDMCPVGG
jgi:hypothetical protein